MKTVSYILPWFISLYLTTGDDSILEEHEVKEINAWLEEKGLSLTDCIGYEESDCTSLHDMKDIFLACRCLKYTFKVAE